MAGRGLTLRPVVSSFGSPLRLSFMRAAAP